MKKIKLLMPIVGASITAITPITTLVSCSNATVEQQLVETTISEFKEICKIPHSSDKLLYKVPYKSNVFKLSDYLKKRIEQLVDTKVWQDMWGNLWFDVKYNDEQYKDKPTIALQAHMDMVFTHDPTKYEPGKEPDKLTTPVEIVDEKDKDGNRVIHSKDFKTSIGADNGVGVAQILALISNPNVKHGNLRVILTNCEENAMQGAKMLIGGTVNDLDKDPEDQHSGTNPHVLDDVKYMLNIDGETEGEIVTACSGGVGSHYTRTYTDDTDVRTSGIFQYKYKLTVDGFDGGHSGSAPAEHKGNALIIANEILEKINGEFGEQNDNIQLASISTPGTTVYNLVPKTCIVEFATNKEVTNFSTIVSSVYSKHNDLEKGQWDYFADMKKDQWKLEPTEITAVLSQYRSDDLLWLQKELGYGVIEWDEANFKKTSRNIAPCTLTYDADKKTIDFKLSTYSRSDDPTYVTAFKNENMALASEANVDYTCDAEFPSWKGDSKNDLVKLTETAMKNAGIKETTEAKIHGGVECSWWANAMKDISGIKDAQTVSYGPRIDGCHESTETLYVDTLDACIKTTIYIIQNIK